MSGLEFPEARAGLRALIDGTVHDGVQVTVFYELTIDYVDFAPAVLIYTTGGTEGFVDRVDRCTVEVYAPGEQAVRVAESIRRTVTHPDGVEVDVAMPPDPPLLRYFDAIETDVVPVDVPYADERVNLARASYRVTSRPV